MGQKQGKTLPNVELVDSFKERKNTNIQSQK